MTVKCLQRSLNLAKWSCSPSQLGLHSWTVPKGYDTGIQVYNCITRTNVPIVLRNKNIASWYTCGPTVYAPSHLGHASCYVKVDIIQRILKNYFNINLITAMNITDIDDKIIQQCSEDVTWQDVSRENEESFWKDLKKLHITEPDIVLRVSEHIPNIIKYISKLLDLGAAYVGKDNSVYFKVDKCDTYGKLQKIILEKGVEHEVKEEAADFALWKAAKANEPYWNAPWGKGRPGWHIECSTMASKVFGDCIDFHAGGLDLKFPHHENEEAQSCTFHNKSQWVNYWLHTGQLYVKGDTEKMSKSLKNTISIGEYLEHNSSDSFRMACILSNYRNSMIYSDEMLLTAKNTLQKLLELLSDAQAYIDGKRTYSDFDSSQIYASLAKTEDLIDAALKSDFDTSKATSHLIHLAAAVGKAIQSNVSQEDVQCSSNIDSVIAVSNYCQRILNIFGFNIEQSVDTISQSDSIDVNLIVENMITLRRTIRERAKSGKNNELFKISDEIRGALLTSGIEIKDHEKGCTWKIFKK